MDEQRVQEYLSLIEQLLNCSKGREVALLEAHSDLLDEGLLSIKELSFSFKGLVSKTNEITRVSADLRGFGEEVGQI
jgi:hypothetical protein